MVYDESILEHKHKKMLQSFEFCIVDVSLRRIFVNKNQFFKTSSRAIVLGLCAFSLHGIEARAEMEIMSADDPVVEAVETLPQNKTLLSEASVLTEDSIKELYKQSANSAVAGASESLAFLEKHTHDNALSTLHMRTQFQGKPPEKRTIVIDKETVLKDTKGAYEKGQVNSVETEIISMEIKEDGQSATVTEKTSSDYTLNLSDKKMLSVASKQSCETEIVLHQNVVQTKESECDVEVNVKPKK